MALQKNSRSLNDVPKSSTVPKRTIVCPWHIYVPRKKKIPAPPPFRILFFDFEGYPPRPPPKKWAGLFVDDFCIISWPYEHNLLWSLHFWLCSLASRQFAWPVQRAALRLLPPLLLFVCGKWKIFLHKHSLVTVTRLSQAVAPAGEHGRKLDNLTIKYDDLIETRRVQWANSYGPWQSHCYAKWAAILWIFFERKRLHTHQACVTGLSHTHTSYPSRHKMYTT